MANDLFDKLNGMTYTHNGIHGKLRYETYTDRFGLPIDKLWHEPSSRGKKAPAYLETKRVLRDDWVTDLTNDPDKYCAIAVKLAVMQ